MLTQLLLDKVERLELTVDDGRSIQAHPLVYEGGVGAPEVVVGAQVAIQLLRPSSTGTGW